MSTLNESQIRELIKTAIDMRAFAYTPYSNFKVGAALLTKSGKVYTGCNIENAGYTPSNCAERTAFFKAVSEGERSFRAIAVVGGKALDFCEYFTPCGVCRQVMAEFCDESFTILLGNSKGIKSFSLKEILPLSFTKKDL
jgi:cytidine deaminase